MMNTIEAEYNDEGELQVDGEVIAVDWKSGPPTVMEGVERALAAFGLTVTHIDDGSDQYLFVIARRTR